MKKTGKPQRKPRPQSSIDKDVKNLKKQTYNEKRSFKKEVGSKGGDPRNVAIETADSKTLIYRDQTRAIVSNPILIQQSYWMPILSIMSQAFSRGFSASTIQTGDPNAPYYAWVYLIQALESGVLDAEPLMTEAPLWFAILYQFLRPGSERFRTGEIAYKFMPNTDGPYPFQATPTSPINWNMPGTAWAFGYANTSGNNVNGYLELTAPSPYTDDLGRTSYNLLTQFFSNNTSFPMWKLVPLSQNVFKTFDSSAYVAAYPEVGNCLGTNCGMITELFSEVFIKSPLLSVFSSWEEVTFRSFSHSRQWGGGGCYLGARLQELAKPFEIRNKVRPVFKMIDFNEFYEVIALWLAGAMAATQGNINQTESTPLICPLSVQDFRILLRQALMSIFNDSQSSSQDFVFYGTDIFYAFVVAAGTCGKSIANTMLLPIILVENIRAFIRRTIKVGKSGVSILDFIPVWGMWNNDISAITNYEYTYNEATYPVFSTLPEEMAINLIDGSAVLTSPPTTYYLDLNGGQLSINLAAWNQFVQLLTANSCTLSPLGSEKGISALEVLTMSCVNLPLPAPSAPLPVSTTIVGKEKNRQSAERPKNLGAKRAAFKRLNAGAPVGGAARSPYSFWVPTFISSNQPVLSSSWTECQIYWILPSTRTEGLPENPANFASYQSNVCEPSSFYISATGNIIGVASSTGLNISYNNHLTYASIMYSPVANKSNTLEDFLVHSATTGRGSFLGRLAGNFIGGLVGQSEIGGEIGSEIF